MNKIVIRDIDITNLHDRMRLLGITADLDAEVDSRFVHINEPLVMGEDGLCLNEIGHDGEVDADQLGFVFWTWVASDEAVLVVSDGAQDSEPFLDYFAGACPPFGEAIDLTSGSEDDGDYVAFVISYSQLITHIESCEAEG